MNVRLSLPIVLASSVVACVLFFGQKFTATAPAKGLAAETAKAQTGTVNGRVVYKADQKRLWRYARYYVKDKKTGSLAESVVALRSAELRKTKWPVKKIEPTVDQKDLRFVPETVVVQVGDMVTFTNSDALTHNVHTNDGAKPFNVNMPLDGSYQVEFDRAGGTTRPIRLGCVFHSGMQAWIYVFDHPFHQLTGTDGKFEFRDVPAGTYQLRMVHPSGSLAWVEEIEVSAGQTKEIIITVSPDNLTEKKR